VDHPVGAGLRSFQGLFTGDLVAGVRDGSIRVVKARGSNVEVSLAIADWVVRRAVVGGLEHNGGAVVHVTNVGASSDFPALAAGRCLPVATAKGLRDGCRAIEFGTVFVSSGSREEGV